MSLQEWTFFISNLYIRLLVVNVWGKRFKLPQLTHERFFTIDHPCKIFFWYLPNWTSTDLWCVVLYVTYSTTHQRSVEVQFGRYQKIFCRRDLWSKIYCVLVADIFPILGRFFVNNVGCQSNHFCKTYNKAKSYEKSQIFNLW